MLPTCLLEPSIAITPCVRSCRIWGLLGEAMNVYGDPVSDALREASSKVAERATSQLLSQSVS
jgi:hypothetical protein